MMKDGCWSCFSCADPCGERFAICGPAGCAVYSCEDISKPEKVITCFGGIACAALYGKLLVIVGRPYVHEEQKQYSLMRDEPNLGAWRAASLTDKAVMGDLQTEEEDEDMVRNHGMRSVRIVNLNNCEVVAELFMKSAVCGVGLNALNLVVILEDCTYIYKTYDVISSAMKLPKADLAYGPFINGDDCKPVAVIPTPLNTNGIFALSSGDGNSHSVLALPGAKTGSVVIFDITEMTRFDVEELHGHAIAALAISCDGNVLATCSEEGKNIILCSISGRSLTSIPPKQLAIRTLRRGNTPAVPTCLVLNKDATLLASASVNGTIHVFENPAEEWNNLIEQRIAECTGTTPEPETPAPQQQMSFFSATLSAISSFYVSLYQSAVPIFAKDYIATIGPLTPQTRIVCGWNNEKRTLVVIESSGNISTYMAPYTTKKASSALVEMRIDDVSETCAVLTRDNKPAEQEVIQVSEEQLQNKGDQISVNGTGNPVAQAIGGIDLTESEMFNIEDAKERIDDGFSRYQIAKDMVRNDRRPCVIKEGTGLSESEVFRIQDGIACSDARALLAADVPVEDVSRASGLPVERVWQLKHIMKNGDEPYADYPD